MSMIDKTIDSKIVQEVVFNNLFGTSYDALYAYVTEHNPCAGEDILGTWGKINSYTIKDVLCEKALNIDAAAWRIAMDTYYDMKKPRDAAAFFEKFTLAILQECVTMKSGYINKRYTLITTNDISLPDTISTEDGL